MNFRLSSVMLAIFSAVTGVVLLVLLSSAVYTVDESQQAIILRFGKPIGEPITEPGLKFKRPFTDEVRYFDKRLLGWDGFPNEIPTKGREYIFIDTMARWRIVDPLKFLESVRDESGAQSRLDDIIDSTVRDEVSSLDLEEIVRSTTWSVDEEELSKDSTYSEEGSANSSLTRKILTGREGLTARILKRAAAETSSIGVELVDVRIKRVNYIESVQRKVYDRMISERERIASKFRSQGEGKSAEIRGQTAKELQRIRSEAQRVAEAIRGRGDAEAAGIYGEAYSAAPEFYAFLRTLESYSGSVGKGMTLVLDGNADYFNYLSEIGVASDDLQNADIDSLMEKILSPSTDVNVEDLKGGFTENLDETEETLDDEPVDME